MKDEKKVNWEQDVKTFESYLEERENAEATIKKYLRDVGTFRNYLKGERKIEKSDVLEYKEWLIGHYSIRSVNSMLAALDQFLKKRGGQKRVLMAETPDGVRRVDAEEICYMEAFAHSCELHTLSECITVKSGISALEKEAVRIGVPLFRCHRSYAVNIAQVRAIEREAALLSDGSRIPVSRRLYQELNRQFIDYFLKRER